MGKKPEIRYKAPEDIKDLAQLQYKILENSAKYLKAGGVLVYSTCTVNPEENEAVTNKFVSRHPEFSYESADINGLDFSKGFITLLPHKNGTDGFYIAKLRKNND